MHTSLYRVLRMLEEDDAAPFTSDLSRADFNLGIRRLLGADAAHFVISPKLLDIATRNDVQKSHLAMVKAGIRSLPFDPVLMEWRDGSHIHFARIGTKPLGPVAGILDGRRSGQLADLWCYPMLAVPGETLWAVGVERYHPGDLILT